MANRRIIVDDTDQNIQYEGNWFVDAGNITNQDHDSGPTFFRTQHGTTTSGSSFSFRFKGRAIHVWGTTNLDTQAGVSNPRWECFVDGLNIGATPAIGKHENNWLLCNQAKFLDGEHVLTVNVTTTGQPFWLDDIQYVHSPNVPLDDKIVRVENYDPSIKYSAGWWPRSSQYNLTQTFGSNMTFDFVGKSVGWVGIIPEDLPRGSSQATYSIDGEEPVSFQLDGLPPPQNATKFNQVFFTTPELKFGSHTLEVVYQGGQTPLSLDFLYVVNATSSSDISDDASVVPPAAFKPPSIGAIIGGGVAGVAVLGLLIIAFIFWRRRQKIEPYNNKSGIFSRSSRHEIAPFMTASFTHSGPYTAGSQSGFLTAGSSSMENTSYTHQSPRQPIFASSSRQELTPFLPSSSPHSGPEGHGLHTRFPSEGSSSYFPNMYTNQSRADQREITSHYARKSRLPSTYREAADTQSGDWSPPSSSSRYSKSPVPSWGRHTAVSPTPQNNARSSQIVLHQDSGIRLPGGEVTLVDIPPTYTPG